MSTTEDIAHSLFGSDKLGPDGPTQDYSGWKFRILKSLTAISENVNIVLDPPVRGPLLPAGIGNANQLNAAARRDWDTFVALREAYVYAERKGLKQL